MGRRLELTIALIRGTQRQFSENICSEDDLRSRIFRIFVVKFLACLPLLAFSNCLQKWYPKKVFWIREFCYCYDKWHNDCVQKFRLSAFVQEFYLLKEDEEECGAVLSSRFNHGRQIRVSVRLDL